MYHEILKCNYIQKERIGCSFDRTTGKLQSKPQTDDAMLVGKHKIVHFLSQCAFMLFSQILSITYPAREISKILKMPVFIPKQAS